MKLTPKTKTWLRLGVPVVAAVLAVASVATDVASTEVRVDIDSRYARFDFLSGEWLSAIVREMTLYDIDSIQNDGGPVDLTIAAAADSKGVALAGISFDGADPVRMTVQVQSRGVYDLDWHPQTAPLAVVTPARATVLRSDGDRQEQAAESLELYNPRQGRSRLSLVSPMHGGDAFRTHGLKSVSFTPLMGNGKGIEFSEIVSGTLVLSALENKQVEIPHGETVSMVFSEPATLSLELQDDAMKLVLSGLVSDLWMGSGKSRWSAMPSWFEYAAHQTWGKALAALLVVLVVPIVVETLYTN